MIKRTHDEFYAKEDWKNNTKESFKYIGEKVLENLRLKNLLDKKISILDIGCSNGDFLFYLSNIIPHAELSGADVMPILLEKTREDFGKYNKEIPQTYLCDIEKGEGMPKQQFDIVFMNGVIGIFDDLKNPLKNFTSLINDSGVGYIWSGFNPYPIDILIKGRVVENNEGGG